MPTTDSDGGGMVFGIGTDISKVSRFSKWVRNPNLISRFFNEREIVEVDSESLERRIQSLSEHYAARFAAKEAFSKALGTGFVGLELSDFGIVNDSSGKPEFYFGKKTLERISDITGDDFLVHVSISHEKEYATAFVVIETGGKKEN